MRRQYRLEEVEIPMTPLIDIVFLLIIFFLVATTFQEEEKDLKVDLPKSSHGTERKNLPKDIIINIRKTGLIVVNGSIISEEKLEKLLTNAFRNNPSQNVILRADKDAYHKYVVRVMNICAKVGIRNISVATFAVEE